MACRKYIQWCISYIKLNHIDWVWFLIHEVFLDHTQRRTTVGRTPLDEWSVRRRDLYLIKQNNHNRQTSMPPVGFFFVPKSKYLLKLVTGTILQFIFVHLVYTEGAIKLYKRNQPLVEASNGTTQNTHKTKSMPPAAFFFFIRTHNPSTRATVVLRLRPRGHWDRHIKILKKRIK